MSSIVQRGVRSLSWSAGAQIVVVGVGFLRSVLLARLLDVETFGIYAGATAIVALCSIPATLGLGGAFLHRAPETTDEDHAASVFLGLQLLSITIWIFLMIAGALIFSHGATQTAILAISIATAIEMLANPAVGVMNRRVVLQRIAKLVIVETVVTAVFAVAMAWYGIELWTLLLGDLLTAVLVIIGYYLWKPYWHPHIAFDRKVIAYYFRFGIPYMFSNMVDVSLRQLDDLYVRYFVGVREMGFYSRAYSFANYPRAILAQPVAMVVGGIFAEVAHDRAQLSKAFFRSSALIVRGSFLFGGLLIVIAPEIVLLLLGEKWLPMVPIFRLFALLTLIEPMRDIMGSLFVALGLPQRLLAYRLIQLAVLVVGLWLLGARWGAIGVALAVNLMLITGVVLMFQAVRSRVDMSMRRLFVAPALGLLVAVAVLLGLDQTNIAPTGMWYSLILKSAVYTLTYCGLLLLIERADLIRMVRTTLAQMKGNRAAKDGVADEWLESNATSLPNQLENLE